MPKQEKRGSLMGLKANNQGVPHVAPIHVEPEVTQVNILDAIDDIAVAAVSPVGGTTEPTMLLNARLPVSLHTLLKRTAQFNEVTMTDILVRALKIELKSGRYKAPPPHWGSK